MANKSLTIIIPAYNEEESLFHLLPGIILFCEQRNFNLIIVNDGSKDKTKEVITGFLDHSCLHLIHHKVNRGYGGALKSGILEASTDYIITIDADGQHYLEDVEKLFAEIVEKDADMIVGSRKGNKGGSVYRSLGKSLIRMVAKILLPLKIYDINSGMKIYNTQYAKKYISICPDSMAFSDIITLLFINNKHLVLETPISIKERKTGQSTISINTAFETLKQIINIVVLFNPMKIFFPVSFMFMITGIAWALPILLRGGGMSVGASLLIIMSIMSFLLGLIAEQLSMIKKNL